MPVRCLDYCSLYQSIVSAGMLCSKGTQSKQKNAKAMMDSSGWWQFAYVNLCIDPNARFDTAETSVAPGPIKSSKRKVS